jgi:hypothetical protein
MNYKITKPHKQIGKQLNYKFWDILTQQLKPQLSIKVYIQIREEIMISNYKELSNVSYGIFDHI